MTGKFSGAVAALALMTAQTAFASGISTPPSAAPASTPLAPLAPGGAAGIPSAQTSRQLNGIAIGAGLLLGATAIYLIVGTHYHVPAQNNSAAGTN